MDAVTSSAEWKASNSPKDGKRRSVVNVVLAGKGGAGKTTVASMLATAFRQEGLPTVCIDTDTINGSLRAIASLGAEPVRLINEDGEVDVVNLNATVSRAIAEDANFVIDTGAESFLTLSEYFVEGGVFEVIADAGKYPVVHSVVAGGSSLAKSVETALQTVSMMPVCVQNVLWLNRVPKAMRETDQLKALADLFSAVFIVPEFDRLARPIFNRMLERNLTFDDAAKSDDFDVISKLWLDRRWLPLRKEILESL